jgi:hypothetical protein
MAGRREGFPRLGPNQELAVPDDRVLYDTAQRDSVDQVHPREVAVVLGTQRHGQGIQSSGVWTGNGIPDRMPGGTEGADEEDAIRTELRRIREIVQDRLLQIQHEVGTCPARNSIKSLVSSRAGLLSVAGSDLL